MYSVNIIMHSGSWRLQKCQ